MTLQTLAFKPLSRLSELQQCPVRQTSDVGNPRKAQALSSQAVQ